MKKLNKTKTVNGRTYYNFQCACGSIIERRSDSTATNCGCETSKKLLKNKELPVNSPFTLLEPIINQKSKVLVRCKCGNEFKAHTTVLFRENTRYCKKCQNTVEEYADIGGLRNHPAYGILDSIKQRCLNTKTKTYYYYGAIGITICDEWLNSYKAFCKWADATGYRKGLTIDRIDVTKGYSPDNCRWVEIVDQRENKHMQMNNTSGYVGVSFNKKLQKYESYYSFNRKKYRVGYFTDPKKAYEARLKILKENNIQYDRKGKLYE